MIADLGRPNSSHSPKSDENASKITSLEHGFRSEVEKSLDVIGAENTNNTRSSLDHDQISVLGGREGNHFGLCNRDKSNNSSYAVRKQKECNQVEESLLQSPGLSRSEPGLFEGEGQIVVSCW